MRARDAEQASLLLKQRKAIEVLKNDNAALKDELRLENAHNVAPTAASGSALLVQLQDESDLLTRKIGFERSKLTALLERAKTIQKKTEVQRLSMGGFSAAQKQHVKAKRSVKRQENRLQVAWQTRNEALAATGELRRRIEGLRRERLACIEILHKSDTILERDRTTLASLLAESAGIAEQREKVLGEVSLFQSKTARLITNSEAEWNQLSHVIAQDRQARELSRQADIEERDRRTHALVNAELGTKRRASVVGWGLARNKAAQSVSAARMAQLEEYLAAVQAATEKLKRELRGKSFGSLSVGTSTAEALAEQLTAAEDSKFRVFSFVNELNTELEAVEEQIRGFQEELQRARAESDKQLEKRTMEHQAFEATLRAARNEAETYEARSVKAVQRVSALRTAVAELFAAAQCDAAAVIDLLGSDGVTAANVMQHLGIVEQKVNTALQVLLASVQPQEARPEPVKVASKARQSVYTKTEAQLPELLGIEVPFLPTIPSGHADTHGVDEDVELLLDKKALRLAAEKAISRRQQGEDAPAPRHTIRRHLIGRC